MLPTFKIIHSLPEGFFEKAPHELHQIFDGPTLIHLEGDAEETLFISFMLHGNEPSGFLAVQKWLAQHDLKKLPKNLSLLVGNVEAARDDLRHLDDQPDMNRIWSDEQKDAGDYQRMAQKILQELRGKKLYASLDVHNNTGRNPYYACINKMDNQFLKLASKFSETVVYFTEPHSVLSLAMAPICPSLTIESGQPGDPVGIEKLVALFEKVFYLDEISRPDKREEIDVTVYHTMVAIKVPANTKICFADEDVKHEDYDICFVANFDHFNFKEIEEGFVLGKINNPNLKIQVMDNNEENVFDDFFDVKEGQLIFKQKSWPSMFTRNKEVILQDCVGYLMEHL